MLPLGRNVIPSYGSLVLGRFRPRESSVLRARGERTIAKDRELSPELTSSAMDLFSTRCTFMPGLRARCSAVAHPAGPAPTTTMLGITPVYLGDI